MLYCMPVLPSDTLLPLGGRDGPAGEEDLEVGHDVGGDEGESAHKQHHDGHDGAHTSAHDGSGDGELGGDGVHSSDHHGDEAHHEPHYGNHAYHNAELVCTYLSMAIITFFLVENLVQLWLAGPKEFFSHPMHILDLAISITSLTLEALLVESSGAVVTILQLSRFWRFFQISHAFFEVTHLEGEDSRWQHPRPM